MKTRNKILTVVFILLTISSAYTQESVNIKQATVFNNTGYSTAFGFRAGVTSGFTVKQFISANSALDGIIGIRNNSLGLTLLYERYVSAGVQGLNWYYGGGGHAFSGASKVYYFDYGPAYYTKGDRGMGIDGIMGIEYKIRDVPFVLSLDIKPFAELSNTGFWFFSFDPGLGFKVAF